MPPGDVLHDPDDPRWFREIAELAGDAYYRVRLKPDLAVLFVSPTLVDHIGYTADEWRADPLLPMRIIDLRDKPIAAALADSAPGEIFRANLRWVHKDGHTVWLEHHGLLRTNEDGDLLLDGTAYNITSEMTLQDSLEESENRYRLLAENSSDLVVLTGPSGAMEWVSPSVTRLMGWSADEAFGHETVEFMHPDDLPALAQVLPRVKAGQSATAQARIRLADGSYRWFRATITPIVHPDGSSGGRISSFHDIHDLVMAEQALRQTLDAALDPSITLTAVRDDSGRIIDLAYLDLNAAAAAYMGRSRDEIAGTSFLTRYSDERTGELFQSYVHTIETGEPLVLDDFEFTRSSRDAVHHYDVRAVKVADGINLTWRDVTERGEAARALAASEEQYRLLAENSSDIVMRTRDNQVVWVSPSLTRMLGWLPEDWIGRPMTEFGHPDDLAQVVQAREDMLSGDSVVMRIRIKDRHGIYHWTEVHSRLYIGANRRIDGVQSSMRTIDREVEAELELQRRAQYDDLTGMLKRDEAITRLDDIVEGRRHVGAYTAVLFVDLDSFKDVNDTLGHAAGDAVLETVSVRIRESVRSGDTTARMGGDEFLVVLAGVQGLDEAAAVAEKIRAAAARPIVAGPTNETVAVSVSVGVTLAGSGESADQIIARADAAMYRAKDSGRDQVVAV